VAVLLELARVLPAHDLPRPLWLAFFDLEDGGGVEGRDWILGSRALAAALPSTPAAAVIVDMIGDADLQIYYEGNSDPVLRETIWATASSLGYDSFIASPGYSMIDDHIPFIERGIPSVLIIDFDYPYWHTTEDTIDKVSAASLEQVGRTLEAWVLAQP
jgi:Zn-dependent M28 family amino/carboxypeptidase